jgi:hypothetical protein
LFSLLFVFVENRKQKKTRWTMTWYGMARLDRALDLPLVAIVRKKNTQICINPFSYTHQTKKKKGTKVTGTLEAQKKAMVPETIIGRVTKMGRFCEF